VTIVGRRILRFAAILPAALTLACFEQPITESIDIRFLGRESALVRVTVRLADPGHFKESPAARDRIEAARRAIVELRDPWSDRLASLAPEEERITWDRSRGDVVRFDHRAIVADAVHLHSFFKDTLVQAQVTRREETTELTLTPWAGGRAGRPEAEKFERARDAWAEAVARYLEAGGRLYDYLEANPGRARPCFANLFKDLLPEDAREGADTLNDRDEEVVDPFSDAMAALLGLFEVTAGEAYSLEELSALVHDPFPAPLTVRVPGPVLEVEGFETGAGGTLRVPTVSLWSAFMRLEDRWITPNPVVVYYRHADKDKERLDLDAFLAQPRSVTRPAGVTEIVDALAKEMRSAPVYRVRWSTAGLEEPQAGENIWDQPDLQ
jgi:hypothetical protein